MRAHKYCEVDIQGVTTRVCVCECVQIGFNAGHSAIVWLEGLNTSLRSFDVFKLPYADACRRSVAERYPGRVQFFAGSSTITVPKYSADVQAGRAAACDLWFVDGEYAAPSCAAALCRS